MSIQPLEFVVLFGPTGSGKSTVMKVYIACCLTDAPVLHAAVDNLVESDPEYRHKVQKIQLQKLKTKELQEKLVNLYFEVRNKPRGKKMDYNKQNEKNVKKALSEQKNNIFFEITGANEKTVQKLCLKTLFSIPVQYTTTVLVSYTPFEKLKDRIECRFQKECVRFTKPPDRDNWIKTWNNLKQLIKCKFVSKLVIFDNSGKKISDDPLIFEAKKLSQFQKQTVPEWMMARQKQLK
jgi:energy-coupling factor transporter ATP-binding protein EcfA2